MENKCENCGGEGLIHQGESIKFTCNVCSGTGKADGAETVVPSEEQVEALKDESFSTESEEAGETSEGEEVPAEEVV